MSRHGASDAVRRRLRRGSVQRCAHMQQALILRIHLDLSSDPGVEVVRGSVDAFGCDCGLRV